MRFREVSPVPTASDGDSLAGGAAVAAGFSDNAELTQLLVVDRSEELLTRVHRLRSGDRLVVRGFLGEFRNATQDWRRSAGF